MLFNSFAFIFVFAPITLIAYYLLNHFEKYDWAKWALIMASFIFYGSGKWQLCFLLGASIVVNFFLQHRIVDSIKHRKLLAVIGVIINLIPLYYFKYLNFSIRIIDKFVQGELSALDIALPLGISFFTFQQISVIVDSVKENSKKLSFTNYALFVSFFPQLVAGPIVLHDEMMPQFESLEKRKFNSENFYDGLIYFFLGLTKKVLIADRFALLADTGFEAANGLNSLSAIIVIVSYTLQIYFDFSGYCDMAMGLGRMFNVELPVNFNSPYKAKTIKEFWDRWHMTLTRFLTHYVYFPLGGSRRGKGRTYINVLIVFLVSGIWHGASFLFIFWGLLHGIAMVVYRFGRKFWDKLPKVLMQAITFIFVALAWVFFRAAYFGQAFSLILHAFIGGLGGVSEGLSNALCEGSIADLVLVTSLGQGTAVAEKVLTVIWIVAGLLICFCAPSSHEIVRDKSRNKSFDIMLMILAAWCVVRFSQFSSFIYFNF